MTRAQKLAAVRFAAYHGDKLAYTRLYVDASPRIGHTVWIEQVRAGKRDREIGVRCGCVECKEVA